MIRIGHVIDRLREMPDHAVHCAVTSPPYYGLRDYGLAPVIWEPVRYAPMSGMPEMSVPAHADPLGASPEAYRECEHDWGDQKHGHGQFCGKCGAWRGCLGLEPEPALYIGHLVQVFRALRRVLRPDGTLWLNLGDSYASGNRGTRDSDKKLTARGMDARPRDPSGIKPKDLMGIPWRAALALQADGWWLRSDIVWMKGNAMPESVTDRPTRSHEMVFLLTPSARYFYDHVSVMEPAVHASRGKAATFRRDAGNKREQIIPGQRKGTHRPDRPETSYNGPRRNHRDVWTISTKPYKGAHFAVIPPDLVDPCIRAGTSEAGVCPHCGKPWVREVVRECCAPGEVPDSYCGSTFHKGKSRDARKHLSEVGETPRTAGLRTVGWRAGCGCPSHDPVPATVLDPFGGSGTVAMVAKALGRDWEIIEANPDYVPLAEARLHQPAKPQRGAKQRRGAKSGDVRLRGLEPDHLQPTQQMEIF